MAVLNELPIIPKQYDVFEGEREVKLISDSKIFCVDGYRYVTRNKSLKRKARLELPKGKRRVKKMAISRREFFVLAHRSNAVDCRTRSFIGSLKSTANRGGEKSFLSRGKKL